MNPSVAPLFQRGNDIFRRPCGAHCDLPLLLLQPRPLRLPLSPALGVAALNCLQSHEYICCWKCDNTADSAENHARKVESGTVPVLAPCEGGFLDAPHAISTRLEEGEGSLLGAGEVRTGDHVSHGSIFTEVEGDWVLETPAVQPCVLWPFPAGVDCGKVNCGALVWSTSPVQLILWVCPLCPCAWNTRAGTSYCSACTHAPLPMATGSECPLTPLPL